MRYGLKYSLDPKLYKGTSVELQMTKRGEDRSRTPQRGRKQEISSQTKSSDPAKGPQGGDPSTPAQRDPPVLFPFSASPCVPPPVPDGPITVDDLYRFWAKGFRQGYLKGLDPQI